MRWWLGGFVSLPGSSFLSLLPVIRAVSSSPPLDPSARLSCPGASPLQTDMKVKANLIFLKLGPWRLCPRGEEGDWDNWVMMCNLLQLTSSPSSSSSKSLSVTFKERIP